MQDAVHAIMISGTGLAPVPVGLLLLGSPVGLLLLGPAEEESNGSGRFHGGSGRSSTTPSVEVVLLDSSLLQQRLSSSRLQEEEVAHFGCFCRHQEEIAHLLYSVRLSVLLRKPLHRLAQTGRSCTARLLSVLLYEERSVVRLNGSCTEGPSNLLHLLASARASISSVRSWTAIALRPSILLEPSASQAPKSRAPSPGLQSPARAPKSRLDCHRLLERSTLECPARASFPLECPARASILLERSAQGFGGRSSSTSTQPDLPHRVEIDEQDNDLNPNLQSLDILVKTKLRTPLSVLYFPVGVCFSLFAGITQSEQNSFAADVRDQSIVVFLSIDCGDPWGTRTDDLGIKWVGDGGYVNTGKTAKVQVNNSYYGEEQTLRYFPSQKRSCYVIPGVNRGRKHMVRAHFFYGNYDGKSSPPSFDLQFDGNNWANVTTSSITSYYHEVIYAPKGDMISVCVAQTSPDQIPFISILETRELAPAMYDTDNTEDVLLRWRRRAFGAKDFIRYPDDPFDRYWHPYRVDGIDGVITVDHDNMSFINSSTSGIPVPGLALAHAITPASSTATSLTLIVPSSDSGSVNTTAQFYSIFYFSEVSQAVSQNKSRSFDLLIDGVKLNDNPIFPPYLSCARIRNRGPDALQVLRGRYQQLQLWTGDPCLPPGFNWEWLDCNADKPPRVTELHLNGSELNGTLVDFSGLNALQIIDLSNNSLSGKIPDFWGAFPNLKELCTQGVPRLSAKRVSMIPVRQQAGRIQQVANHAFTYEEILKITCNFETLIGKGGSGSVYYGCIGNGNKVAVKVKFLMTVHHKNLVSFVGFCEEDVNMIILYEYMQNGSLRDLLSGKKTTAEPLTWKRRLQIALDIATGLEYIHSGCRPAIIHRDIKSTNILLNERLEAKLADFGIFKADEKTQISTVIAGTPGYIDPELRLRQKLPPPMMIDGIGHGDANSTTGGGARAQVNINIACGATDFTDSNGYYWVGDDQFIQSGSVGRVQFTSSGAPFLSTVRYFPYGSINCYRIPGVTPGNKIQVASIFQYGNYDSLALPPSFWLAIAGSNWAGVQTSMDANLVVYGMIYWAVENTVSVCLAPDSTARAPFISAIQIREEPLNPSTEAPPNPSTEAPPSIPSTKAPPNPRTEAPPPNPGRHPFLVRKLLLYSAVLVAMEKSFLILSVLMPTLINFLHVPSFILGARAQTDIDIACGATESFTDPVYGMQWVDDDKFIEYGSTDVVKFTSPDATFLSTVRYFQDRSMINYCYTIPGVTKGNNITVIAIFLYGNYDSLALPPSFRLQMDGSEWAEVETSMDAELVVYGKTYWAVANDVSLCLARDSAQDSAGDPFISAIQIREAPPSPSTEPPPSPSTEPPPSNSSTKPPPSNASTKPFPPSDHTWSELLAEHGGMRKVQEVVLPAGWVWVREIASKPLGLMVVETRKGALVAAENVNVRHDTVVAEYGNVVKVHTSGASVGQAWAPAHASPRMLHSEMEPQSASRPC
ncbi:Activin receptor type-2A [Nymphaea thermarum]|nr:Activin receptor type-2A [Nymphaea thermarum]